MENESLILAIETSTSQASVGLFSAGSLISLREYSDQKSHARLVPVIARRIFEDHKLKFRDLSAVAVSSGPGSYTGLRIGASLAKGLCMSHDIPLIGFSSLLAIAHSVKETAKIAGADILVMMDARRMEVYKQRFDSSAKPLDDATPFVVEEKSFDNVLEKGKIIFAGDGVAKCFDILENKQNALLLPGTHSTVRSLGPYMEERLRKSEFDSLINFEPDYLKSFVATKSKKKLI